MGTLTEYTSLQILELEAVERNSTYFAPIESIVQIKGLSSSPNPAITGWHKYGPNLDKTK